MKRAGNSTRYPDWQIDVHVVVKAKDRAAAFKRAEAIAKHLEDWISCQATFEHCDVVCLDIGADVTSERIVDEDRIK